MAPRPLRRRATTFETRPGIGGIQVDHSDRFNRIVDGIIANKTYNIHRIHVVRSIYTLHVA